MPRSTAVLRPGERFPAAVGQDSLIMDVAYPKFLGLIFYWLYLSIFYPNTFVGYGDTLSLEVA